ncbi:MAG: glycerol-3-phosphate 1-O-acyltransferase PlsY [Campylobacterales bacterium]|jgi:glycerol-3-phosphate acyltransferase PlsY|nr:glycerol-3-phosphate 1-O-acyltransferase PlsY [Campylobacterales bacterium]NLM99245.1 glycerol-3-phosphate 1-O-acyltransferase PlsY [Campylobacteraceae bacterium]
MLTNINILFYLLAYFIGGIPFGLVLAKLFAKTDIRELGSRSIGATNVLRVLKDKNPSLAKKLAITTVILDGFKGLSLILIAHYLNLPIQTAWTIGVLAVIGHCFSPYLKFEGGKGVATALGVIIYFLPLEALVAIIVWFIVSKSVKISSVASLGGLLALIISSFLIHYEMPHINTHAPIIIIAFIVIYKHIPNIIRLFKGEEGRVI